jgi:hypothetical protein
VNFVDNPAWVGQVLADTLKTVQSTVPPGWLPAVDSVKRGRGGAVVSKVKEYGCGVYGCVIPTLDPLIVMKLTTDDTEAQFAADVAATLVAPICVAYHMVLETRVKHERRKVYLLWRDSADDVGRIRYEPNGDWAVHYINKQHAAAQVAFQALRAQGMTKETDRLLVEWAESCEAMARQTQFPGLRELGEGLVENWGQLSILFGDIHEGNLGRVNGKWVITDPGNIAVVDRTLVKNPARGMRHNPNEVAVRINNAARKVATGPGRGHAYISDVWKQLERDGGNPARASYDEFICELINLYRSGEIGLAPAKNKRSVAAEESVVEIGNNTFHLVVVAQAASPPPAPVAKRAPAPPAPATSARRSTHAMSDADFARVVDEVVSNAPPEARVGRKVFISAIWDVASADPEIDSMGLPEFKRRLYAAHRAQLLSMSRADYVAAMDPALVRKSENKVDGATYHFVEDRRFNDAVRPAASAAAERVDLLGTVKNAVATMPARGRHRSSEKVFISELWRVISEDPRIRPIGLKAFKRWLIDENRQQHLDLARADLVDDMDPKTVEDSEIVDLGASFHFVIDPEHYGRHGEFRTGAGHVPGPPPRPATGNVAASSGEILAAVQKASIEMPASGRFGPEKVFVSEIWRVISQDPRIRPMGLDGFKKWLVAGNRDGILDLKRADLVAAMNREQVTASEINSLGTTFHFVSRDRWGTFGY